MIKLIILCLVTFSSVKTDRATELKLRNKKTSSFFSSFMDYDKSEKEIVSEMSKEINSVFNVVTENPFIEKKIMSNIQTKTSNDLILPHRSFLSKIQFPKRYENTDLNVLESLKDKKTNKISFYFDSFHTEVNRRDIFFAKSKEEIAEFEDRIEKQIKAVLRAVHLNHLSEVLIFSLENDQTKLQNAINLKKAEENYRSVGEIIKELLESLWNHLDFAKFSLTQIKLKAQLEEKRANQGWFRRLGNWFCRLFGFAETFSEDSASKVISNLSEKSNSPKLVDDVEINSDSDAARLEEKESCLKFIGLIDNEIKSLPKKVALYAKRTENFLKLYQNLFRDFFDAIAALLEKGSRDFKNQEKIANRIAFGFSLMFSLNPHINQDSDGESSEDRMVDVYNFFIDFLAESKYKLETQSPEKTNSENYAFLKMTGHKFFTKSFYRFRKMFNGLLMQRYFSFFSQLSKNPVLPKEELDEIILMECLDFDKQTVKQDFTNLRELIRRKEFHVAYKMDLFEDFTITNDFNELFQFYQEINHHFFDLNTVSKILFTEELIQLKNHKDYHDSLYNLLVDFFEKQNENFLLSQFPEKFDEFLDESLVSSSSRWLKNYYLIMKIHNLYATPPPNRKFVFTFSSLTKTESSFIELSTETLNDFAFARVKFLLKKLTNLKIENWYNENLNLEVFSDPETLKEMKNINFKRNLSKISDRSSIRI